MNDKAHPATETNVAAVLMMTDKYEPVVIALKRALSWLSSYPGGCADSVYIQAVNALKGIDRYE